MEQVRPNSASTALNERVNAITWFHRIDLGQGIVSPGADDTPRKIAGANLPEDLTGKTVIDVGSWDGGFSFECEKRGASRVLATDQYVWDRFGTAGFDLAHEILGSRVERKRIPVEDLSADTVGVFDLVLFLGVLYHAQDPLRYLRNVASICKGQAIVETHIDAVDYDRPAAVFYPGAVLNNDASNFWGPNPMCVQAMLMEVGFSRVQQFEPWFPSRMVFHAWK